MFLLFWQSDVYVRNMYTTLQEYVVQIVAMVIRLVYLLASQHLGLLSKENVTAAWNLAGWGLAAE